MEMCCKTKTHTVATARAKRKMLQNRKYIKKAKTHAEKKMPQKHKGQRTFRVCTGKRMDGPSAEEREKQSLRVGSERTLVFMMCEQDVKAGLTMYNRAMMWVFILSCWKGCVLKGESAGLKWCM